MLLCATILMASCQTDVETTIEVSEVTLDKTELSLVVDASETLVATVLPDDAEEATVAWSSSDKTVATVSEDGVVSALKAGETTITASAGGKTATCKVTVTIPVIAVTGVTLNKTTTDIEKGKTEKLVSTIAPANATDQTVTWYSSNETAVTVAQDGTVTAVAAGEATIIATSTSNITVTATCKVTVTKPNYTEVNGIKVAVGNLVADGANGAKIGAATDGGLFFQFGSLVGWSATEPLAIAVKPVGYTGSTSWNESWAGDTANEDATAGTGDPCKYYLKGTWRLPTVQEYAALFKDNGYTTTGPWTWNATSKSATHTSGLAFPASGSRSSNDGSLRRVGESGNYWSATPNGASYGYFMDFVSNEMFPGVSINQSIGKSVRCVQDASN